MVSMLLGKKLSMTQVWDDENRVVDSVKGLVAACKEIDEDLA